VLADRLTSAYVPDPILFQSARQFAAWLGLTARQRAKVAAVMLANKTGRIAWAILQRKEACAVPSP
jgi:hypothetical protein